MKRKVRQTLPVLIIIGITIIMSLILYQRVLNREEKKCWQYLEDSAQSVTRELQTTFENNIATLRLAADTMLQMDQWQENRIDENQLEIFRENTIFSRIDIIYPDNQIRVEKGTTALLRSDLSFAEIADAGEHMSARMTDTESGEEAVYYFVPLQQNGQTVAILSGVIASSAIKASFHPSIYQGQAVCCIIDSKDGNFIMDQWHEELGNAYTMPARTRLKGYEDIDLKEETKEQKTGIIAFQSHTTGQNLYMYYMPVQMFDWELEVFVPEDIIFENLFFWREMLVFVGIVESILLLVYFLWNVHAIRQLADSKAETVEQLQISNTLLSCVTALSSDKNIESAIQKLLKIVTEYFHGDRAYIFIYHAQSDCFVNTYEYAKNGVVSQKDTMPEIPAVNLERGIRAFEEHQVYYTSIEQEQGFPTYDILKNRGISRLLAVPLRKNGKISGFVSVDNPRESSDNASLLMSIPFFISNSLATKEYQDELQFMSYRDELTSMYNRNKYIQILETLNHKEIKNLGVAYLDLNGLKEVNDSLGHKAGDAMICGAAEVIRRIFPEMAYRVGGDEFVIIASGMAQSIFVQKVNALANEVKNREISISMGVIWKASCNDLEQLLKEADSEMYEKKQEYYRKISSES